MPSKNGFNNKNKIHLDQFLNKDKVTIRLNTNNQKTIPCRDITTNGFCPRGLKCTYAHSLEELNIIDCQFNDRCTNDKCKYFHSKFQTKEEWLEYTGYKNSFNELIKRMFKSVPCTEMIETGKCPRDKDCTFAHSVDELNPVNCRFAENCNNLKCKYLHPNQTKEEWLEKTGYKKSCENIPVRVPISVPVPILKAKEKIYREVIKEVVKMEKIVEDIVDSIDNIKKNKEEKNKEEEKEKKDGEAEIKEPKIKSEESKPEEEPKEEEKKEKNRIKVTIPQGYPEEIAIKIITALYDITDEIEIIKA